MCDLFLPCPASGIWCCFVLLQKPRSLPPIKLANSTRQDDAFLQLPELTAGNVFATRRISRGQIQNSETILPLLFVAASTHQRSDSNCGYSTMSGIEVAGLVLGAFPILINCLDHYREGFGSLGEWWNFQNSLKEFIDGIERQMMRYHENMVSLLEPIVSDAERMAALARNISDPRWTDGSLNGALRKRLASEHDRYFRVVERMQELVAYLEKLLGIGDFEDGKVGQVLLLWYHCSGMKLTNCLTSCYTLDVLDRPVTA